jgi:hypothetical protein
MENHVHKRKRTWPLRGERAGLGGVVYVGDGSWGVDHTECGEGTNSSSNGAWPEGIFAAMGFESHIWVLQQ